MVVLGKDRGAADATGRIKPPAAAYRAEYAWRVQVELRDGLPPEDVKLIGGEVVNATVALVLVFPR